MSCNKEEAIRAKEIAEKKMQTKDFSGALKIAAKAQKLCQDLENISQMILVCDVHCASEKRLYGDVMDWYAILKLERTADESTIKKQYRKFALQLHPDKNKFPGAEAAFKLIGDAQRTLLDKDQRSLHDMKHKVTVNGPPPAAAQNNFRANFAGQQQQQPPTQTGFTNVVATFWTKCPFCTVRYQYYKQILYKSIRCQTCKKIFTAYDSGVVPQGSNRSQFKFPQQGVAANQGSSKVDQGSQRSFTAANVFTAFTPSAARFSEPGTVKVNGKRGRKQTVESSESSSESEEDMENNGNVNVTVGKKFNSQVEQDVRRSGRHKQHVSYDENLSDEDTVRAPKKAKISGPPCANEESEELPNEHESKQKNRAGEVKKDRRAMDQREGKSFEASSVKETAKGGGLSKPGKAHADGLKENSNPIVDDSVSDPSSKETKEPLIYDCPEPEFYDFDSEKKENCFSAGQIWALYDTLDGMPRFYARIRKISSGFKLRITWLELDPADANEIAWASKGLPVSCGKFKHGDSENIEDPLMFSHLLCWEKGTSRDTYKIFPRKGETWALFRNWNINWKTGGAGTDQKYEYEFVEILSEGAEGGGIQVAYLTKVKGFVSVFCKTSKNGVDTLLIPPNELFRFSHKVPSFGLTGEEREGVPKGSFELDTNSLPEEIFVPKDLKANGDNSQLNSSASEVLKPMVVGSDEPDPPASTSKTFEIPESEFYDFDGNKSLEKFLVGQVWALYGDEDGLPKYYGEIKKIESHPVSKIHVGWLLPCPSETRTEWYDKNMPTCCGRFRVGNGSQVYSSTESFSHKLKAESTGTKNEYVVSPKTGEIWALYRNWSPEIKCSDLENWQYDIVLVMEETDRCIKAIILEHLDGFNSVFKAEEKEGSNVAVEISRVDQLKFSHQIPYFQLTKERNGSLRGCWELDPAALPVHYYMSS